MKGFWYILLCFASILLFVYTIWKKKDIKLIAFYFIIAGLTYFLEYIVLVLLEGYTYYPKLMKNTYYDNILGAIVSDGFTIPMTTTFVAAFRLNISLKVFMAATITLVEIMFVKVNIYEHQWWSYIYTFGGAIIFYHYGEKWLTRLKGSITYLIRYMSLFFGNLAVHASIVFVLVAVFSLYFYDVAWFEDPFRSHVAFSTLYIIFTTTIFVSIITFRLSRVWIGVGILIPSLVDIMLLKMNILMMSDRWSLISFLIFRIIIFTILLLFNKFLLKTAKFI